MHSGLNLESKVAVHWGLRIPMRDGVHLNAMLYTPRDQLAPAPVVLTVTPYICQYFRDNGVYFAAHQYPFVAVDVRGRGDSEGEFIPFANEAHDVADIVEWLVKQPYCSGQVAMIGGSYGGYAQWAAVQNLPPGLATLVPTAAPYIGLDFPIRRNMAAPYWMQWLTLVRGKALQDKFFYDNERYWSCKFREWFESGRPFNNLDDVLGSPSAVFKEWCAHPNPDEYWDQYNPKAEDYARLSIPVLTITGQYDGDQAGALAHYREHVLRNKSAQHFLVIGPWDHAGTRDPKATFAGVDFGSESVIDIKQLHLDWYAWTMRNGPKPTFLKKKVAYFVAGARYWRYADTLDAITFRHETLYLQSDGNANNLTSIGALKAKEAPQCRCDHYLHDPLDTTVAAIEDSSVAPLSMRPAFPTDDLTDQKTFLAGEGKQLVYHSEQFVTDLHVSGFFRMCAWIGIDQPDTDLRADIYEVDPSGGSVLLSTDSLRARYRENPRAAALVQSSDPQRYIFKQFNFVSRLIRQGSRLRLVIGPVHSIHAEKNYNSGLTVAYESAQDARTVNVRLFHGGSYPSVLEVPIGFPED